MKNNPAGYHRGADASSVKFFCCIRPAMCFARSTETELKRTEDIIRRQAERIKSQYAEMGVIHRELLSTHGSPGKGQS